MQSNANSVDVDRPVLCHRPSKLGAHNYGCSGCPRQRMLRSTTCVAGTNGIDYEICNPNIDPWIAQR